MSRPGDIAPEAIRLLEDADWLWSEWDKAFVKARDPGSETIGEYRRGLRAQISHDTLRGCGLAGRVSEGKRDAGLRWNRRKLSNSD